MNGITQLIKNIEDFDPKLQDLCRDSIEARKMAYTPYSQFKVGAALQCTDGTVIKGCNVENASYGLAICAERTAIVKAVSEGKQEFACIAIAADLAEEFVGPCGACRQFLAEFHPEIPIYLVRLDGKVQVTSLKYLLPDAFTPKRMNFAFHKE
jgi:cytidine deaminase